MSQKLLPRGLNPIKGPVLEDQMSELVSYALGAFLSKSPFVNQLLEIYMRSITDKDQVILEPGEVREVGPGVFAKSTQDQKIELYLLAD